jgi:hypothetical protein
VDKPRRTQNWQRVLFVIVGLGLIITFVRRLFPIEEIPRRPVIGLTIVIDLALAIALVGLGSRILKATPKGTTGRGGWLALFLAGLISSVGIFVIHLSGGQRLEVHSRSQSKSEDLPADLKDMALKMEDLNADFKKAQAEEQNTRWFRVSNESAEEIKRILNRQDWQEYIAKQRTVIETIDRMLEFLSKPNLAADLNRVYNFAQSRGLTGGRMRPNIDLQSWRLFRQRYVAEYNYNKILEEHWDEWHSPQDSQNAEPQPWRKEVDRLINEAREADKQLKELTRTSKSTPTTP